MRIPRLSLFAGAMLVASAAAAQLSVGVFPNSLNSSDANFPTPQTDVSLENPATGSGQISSVTFAWNAGCTAVVKIKFFRRTGNTLTMFDQRGPFDTSLSRVVQNVALSPGVNVQAGDLIGITRVASCGNALAEAGTATQGYVVLTGDATTGTIAAGNTYHDKLALLGEGNTPGNVVAGFFPVVGSTAGSFGSNFKTSLQMINPSNTSTLGGRLIFHAASTSGSLNDRQLTYSLSPGQVLAFTDIVNAMGLTGLGSIDVATVGGADLPIMLARVYNDAGTAGGTAGFFEDFIPSTTGAATRILTPGMQGFLVTPIEPARTRLNIGVRTLDSGVTMTVKLETQDGQELATITKSYQPNWFEQVDAPGFLLGNSISANQKIRIIVTAGSAMVYGATTDNVTNDPAVQFATAVPVP